jgi:hypothetical protein
MVGLALYCGMGGAALAADSGAVKLSAAQCSTPWDKINASGGATIDASHTQGYVTNFKAADPDSDGTLTKTEFQAACAKGLVQDSASRGAAAGTEGSDEDDAADRRAPVQAVSVAEAVLGAVRLAVLTWAARCRRPTYV